MAQIRVCVRIFPFCLFLTQTNTDENNHEGKTSLLKPGKKWSCICYTFKLTPGKASNQFSSCHKPEVIDNMKIKDKNRKCKTSNRKHFVMQLQFPSMEGVAAGELG